MSDAPAIVWFRRDLRLADNPALYAAVATGGAVVPVFVVDPVAEGAWPPGPASRWWLGESLAALDEALRSLPGKHAGGGAPPGLAVIAGDSADVLSRLARQAGASEVFAAALHDPASPALERRVERALCDAGVRVRWYGSGLLNEPGEVTRADGSPLKVFTPFWRRAAAHPVPEPVPIPSGLRVATVRSGSEGGLGPDEASAHRRTPADVLADAYGPARRPPEADGWQPGEAGATALLRRFVEDAAGGYADGRDLVALDGTSRLSPHLHFGEVSAASVVAAIGGFGDEALSGREEPSTGQRAGHAAFLRQLYWREFAHDQLAHHPETATRPLRPEFERFPWLDDEEGLAAWREGRTGYPLVDAGMRQLAATGWMHNRARLAVASFLTKDLLIPWQTGSRVFWELETDADLANNTLGWQWTAGCGADAAPYFRVFNPVLQASRFDPDGTYVHRWVPELAGLSGAALLRPWEAPSAVLASSGVRLGPDYPAPIVDHAEARTRALAALASIRT